MTPSFVIGCDGGTEGIRAGVFHALTGAAVAFAAAPYPTNFPQPSWAEQNPEDWWSALAVCVREAVKQSKISVEDIAALSIDTTCCSVVALDESGNALRPCLLWMDMRSAECANDLLATGDPALRVNSGGNGPVSAEWMIPKALWLKRNEPAKYAAARWVCEYQDFMNLRLTGRMVGSLNNASVRWHFSTESGWPMSLLAALEMPELREKWPPELLPLGGRVGGLTAAAAAHLGLPEGLCVAQGGADAFVGVVGLGVVRPGQLALLTGSSHLHLGLTDRRVSGKGVWGTYADAVIPGLGVVEGGQTSTGSAVAWFKKFISSGGGNVSYEELNAEAAAVPVGCEGLLCLDHFQGNRTPHTDPLSRGAFAGLTLKHTRGHMFRALLEAVCMGTQLVFEAMRSNGYVPESVTVAGGAARSELWLQIHADVSNIPLRLTKTNDACCLGAAMLAAIGAGIYPDIPAAAAAMVHVERTIMPDMMRHEEYQRVLAGYRSLYPALRPIVAGGGSGGSSGESSERRGADGSKIASRIGETGSLTAVREISRAGATPEIPLSLSPAGTSAAPVVLGRVSASLLAADAADLGGATSRALAAGASWIHVDFSDAPFAGTMGFGVGTVAALRRRFPEAFLDVHLACSFPQRLVVALAAAGASQVLFHPEADGVADLGAAALIRQIRAAGMRAGVALLPETPFTAVTELLVPSRENGNTPDLAGETEEGEEPLWLLDCVDVLAVGPGFGGQVLDTAVLEKVAAFRLLCPSLDIQVDGGVNAATVAACVDAGANVLTAGTFIYSGEEPGNCTAPIAALQQALATRWRLP